MAEHVSTNTVMGVEIGPKRKGRLREIKQQINKPMSMLEQLRWVIQLMDVERHRWPRKRHSNPIWGVLEFYHKNTDPAERRRLFDRYYDLLAKKEAKDEERAEKAAALRAKGQDELAAEDARRVIDEFLGLPPAAPAVSPETETSESGNDVYADIEPAAASAERSASGRPPDIAEQADDAIPGRGLVADGAGSAAAAVGTTSEVIPA